MENMINRISIAKLDDDFIAKERERINEREKEKAEVKCK
jgi:hypothetical protein